ncbi:hypothetical protein [Limoniibacter endophyticus]|uniref:Uncharacterized protein n=1 Tax=Limoniibacter endophyticus TaxID=1565040 RepID=A0A8J3DIA1_9HYPH|nr:hypothetical protein [Limoniibacter endophyticus]GHC74126.1 hypothetical protein GCM10010136_22990 [Limoniibacter endophyticus]
MLKLIGQLILILFAYGVGTLCASAFLHVIFVSVFQLAPEEFAILAQSGFIVSVPFIAIIIAYFAILPFAVVVAIGELFSYQGWIFYALGGAGVGALTTSLFQSGGSTAHADPGLYLTAAAAGIVGATGYWFLAGRSAGEWGRIRRNFEDQNPDQRA